MPNPVAMLVLRGARDTIRRVLKGKRLVFKGWDKVVYTNKDGGEETLNFDGFVKVLIGDNALAFSQVGVKPEDLKRILVEEYTRQEVKKN